MSITSTARGERRAEPAEESGLVTIAVARPVMPSDPAFSVIHRGSGHGMRSGLCPLLMSTTLPGRALGSWPRRRLLLVAAVVGITHMSLLAWRSSAGRWNADRVRRDAPGGE